MRARHLLFFSFLPLLFVLPPRAAGQPVIDLNTWCAGKFGQGWFGTVRTQDATPMCSQRTGLTLNHHFIEASQLCKEGIKTFDRQALKIECGTPAGSSGKVDLEAWCKREYGPEWFSTVRQVDGVPMCSQRRGLSLTHRILDPRKVCGGNRGTVAADGKTLECRSAPQQADAPAPASKAQKEKDSRRPPMASPAGPPDDSDLPKPPQVLPAHLQGPIDYRACGSLPPRPSKPYTRDDLLTSIAEFQKSDRIPCPSLSGGNRVDLEQTCLVFDTSRREFVNDYVTASTADVTFRTVRQFSWQSGRPVCRTQSFQNNKLVSESQSPFMTLYNKQCYDLWVRMHGCPGRGILALHSGRIVAASPSSCEPIVQPEFPLLFRLQNNELTCFYLTKEQLVPSNPVEYVEDET